MTNCSMSQLFSGGRVRLDDERIRAADTLSGTDVDFLTGEVIGVDGQELGLQFLRDFLRQSLINSSGGENQFLRRTSLPGALFALLWLLGLEELRRGSVGILRGPGCFAETVPVWLACTQPSAFRCAARLTARAPAGTSLWMTAPAPRCKRRHPRSRE